MANRFDKKLWTAVVRELLREMRRKGLTKYMVAKITNKPKRSVYRYLSPEAPAVPNYETGYLLQKAIEEYSKKPMEG